MEYDHPPTEPEHDPRAAAEAFLKHCAEIERTEGVLAAKRFTSAVLTPLPELDLEAAIALYTGLATSTDSSHRHTIAAWVDLLYFAKKDVGGALWLNLIEDDDCEVSHCAHGLLEMAIEDEKMTEEEAEPFDIAYHVALATRPPYDPLLDPKREERAERFQRFLDDAKREDATIFDRLEREFDQYPPEANEN